MRKFILLGVLILTFLVGLAIGRAGDKSQEFHRLEIVDQEGSVRAEIGTNDDGTAFLRFYDETGRVVWEAPPRAKLTPLEH